MSRRHEADAEASAAHVPKAMTNTEFTASRGELRAMTLSRCASRDLSDNSSAQDIALSQSTGTIKVKSHVFSVPMPKQKEDLRRSPNLVEVHFWCLKPCYPHRKVLQNLGQRTFEKSANYIRGEHVADFGAEVASPSFQLVLSYVFQMRKYMVRRINEDVCARSLGAL